MTSANLEGFGRVLERVRREKGLTNAELAERAGVTRAMISRYENYGVVPREATRKRLLAALDAEPADLDRARVELAFEEAGASGATSVPALLADHLDRLLDDPACRAALARVLSALGHFYETAADALRRADE